jgi:hypothetical protein
MVGRIVLDMIDYDYMYLTCLIFERLLASHHVMYSYISTHLGLAMHHPILRHYL